MAFLEQSNLFEVQWRKDQRPNRPFEEAKGKGAFYSPATPRPAPNFNYEPDSVTALYIAASRYDNHSSRRRITPPLKLSTRTLSEPPQRVPI
jgi:hypothetical protein